MIGAPIISALLNVGRVPIVPANCELMCPVTAAACIFITDAQGLHDSGPPPPGGLAGLALAAQEKLIRTSSEEEEDDFDEVEEDDDDANDGVDEAEAQRSAVLARARLLVHKATILEKEREHSKRNAEEDADTKPIPLGEIAGPAAPVRSGAQKPKGAKGRQRGIVKGESNFSRYRRQSAHSIADEKRKEEVEAVKELVQIEEKKVRVCLFEITSC